MSTSHRLSIALLALGALASAASAQSSAPVSSADSLMNQHLRDDYQNLALRTWVNPLMPAGTGSVADTARSADERLQQMVAGYSREPLDRGGWRNPWVGGDRYAAGEPLLTAAVGAGVTSGGATTADLKRQVAAR
jgi:hypothetical protein